MTHSGSIFAQIHGKKLTWPMHPKAFFATNLPSYTAMPLHERSNLLPPPASVRKATPSASKWAKRGKHVTSCEAVRDLQQLLTGQTSPTGKTECTPGIRWRITQNSVQSNSRSFISQRHVDSIIRGGDSTKWLHTFCLRCKSVCDATKTRYQIHTATSW